MDKIRLHLIIKLKWKKTQHKLTYNAQGKNNTKQTKKNTFNFFKKNLFSENHTMARVFSEFRT